MGSGMIDDRASGVKHGGAGDEMVMDAAFGDSMGVI